MHAKKAVQALLRLANSRPETGETDSESFYLEIFVKAHVLLSELHMVNSSVDEEAGEAANRYVFEKLEFAKMAFCKQHCKICHRKWYLRRSNI